MLGGGATLNTVAQRPAEAAGAADGAAAPAAEPSNTKKGDVWQVLQTAVVHTRATDEQRQ